MRTKLYERRKEALSSSDRKRLEICEQDIAVGTEDYRSHDTETGVRIANCDFGFIAFKPLGDGATLLIAFSFLEHL
jgi:hypothetical protein